MPYNVYVIKLDREVLKLKKFREKNPNLNPWFSCFYVGQTAHDPITRFKQHKQGYKANSYVKRYGIRLAWRKFQRYNPIETRKAAEHVEQWLSNKLRKKGHGVWSN
jgi:predicted GIY-YIG superfamily endonuclease